jgi:hypothetical protein
VYGHANLKVYISEEQETKKLRLRLTVWIDGLDGNLVAAQVRGSDGRCYHMRYNNRLPYSYRR